MKKTVCLRCPNTPKYKTNNIFPSFHHSYSSITFWRKKRIVFFKVSSQAHSLYNARWVHYTLHPCFCRSTHFRLLFSTDFRIHLYNFNFFWFWIVTKHVANPDLIRRYRKDETTETVFTSKYGCSTITLDR